MKGKLLVLIGKSGSGKSAIADELCRSYGLKLAASYTDRPMRFADEKGHTFLSKEQFDKLLADQKIASFTLFDGNRYCTTAAQVDECDIAILDEAGLIYLKANYHGNKKVVSAFIHADENVRIARMINRAGKSPKAHADAHSRALHDKDAFSPLILKHINFIVENTTADVKTTAAFIMQKLTAQGDDHN